MKRSVKRRDSALSSENGNNSLMVKSLRAPIVLKGKLVVVDLAGSERIDKSGVFNARNGLEKWVLPTFFIIWCDAYFLLALFIFELFIHLENMSVLLKIFLC